MNGDPWTGCYKASDGCTNCYFYGPHAKRHGQSTIEKTDKFDWPIRKKANGEYNIKGNKILATCFATDFFLPEADEWRGEVWAMIRERAEDVYKRQIPFSLTAISQNQSKYSFHTSGPFLISPPVNASTLHALLASRHSRTVSSSPSISDFCA